jgi:transcriptional regulator with XRE-family HTH domain
MATNKASRLLKDPAGARKAAGINQAEFWNRFGVTQSGGSRYESGRAIPKPIKLLMALLESGTITDADLKAAAKMASKTKG